MKTEKVEVQKGPLEVGLPTYRTETRYERVTGTLKEQRDRRDGQTLKPHIPKR